MWASQYTYRAYRIRKFWGLMEERQSISALIHPYIENETFHGTGRWSYNDDGELSLQISGVVNGTSKATNPDENAETKSFYLYKNSDWTQPNKIVWDASFDIRKPAPAPQLIQPLKKLFAALGKDAYTDLVRQAIKADWPCL